VDPTEQDQSDQEQSDDYGYDLAHEVPAVDLRGPTPTPHRAQHHDPGRRNAAEAEPDGDYGYDEVHGL